MLKTFSIVLSALMLLQSARMDFADLSSVDELLQHARFHKEKYGDNFLVFLSKHYGELQQEHQKAHQEESGQHEQLPFHHHSCQHLLADFLFESRNFPAFESEVPTPRSCNFYYQETYASLIKVDIFQPPRTT